MIKKKKNPSLANLGVIGLIAFISALYGMPELDEGLIIQWAKSMSEGALPYKDLPVVYGPLYFKINELIFSSFGFLHFTSRIFSFASGFSAFLLMTCAIKKLTNKSFFDCMLFPSIWLIVACEKFSESLHPGWYISLLLSFQALTILNANYKKRNLALGVSSGLLLGMKPHIAMLSIVPLLDSYFIELKVPRWIKLLPILILTAFFLMVLQDEIVKFNVIYLFPFVFTIFLFFYFHYSHCIEEKVDKRPIFLFLLVLSIVGFFIYAPAVYTFGLSNMKYYLFELPRLKYPSFGDNQHEYKFGQISLWIFIFSLVTIVNWFIPRWTQLLDALILLIATYLLSGTNFSIFAFAIIHFLLFVRMPPLLRDKCWPLFIISCAQILHLHPIAGTQLYYASNLIWILLGIYFIELGSVSKFQACLKKIAPACILFVCIIKLPLANAFLSGKELKLLSRELNNNEYILVDKNSNNLIELVKYIENKVEPEGKLLTLPPFYSLNLLSGRKPPNFFISHYLSFLEQDKLKKIMPELMKSDMIIVFPESNRAHDFHKAGTIDNQIFNEVLSNYDVGNGFTKSITSADRYNLEIYLPKVKNGEIDKN